MTRGFTLLETIIAVALLGTMMGSVFVFFANLSDARDRAVVYADRDLACSLLIDRLEADLLTCLVGDRGNGAGVRGNETSVRVLSRAVAANMAEQGRLEPLAFGDLQSTDYRFSGGTLEARRQAIGASAAAESFQPIGSVARLRFRYHDGSSWKDSFDSLAANRLPLAVEVAIWFHPWPEDDAAMRDNPDAAATTAEADLATGNDDGATDFDTDADLRFFGVNPPPDRVRVISIPDADAGDEGESVEFDERTGGEP